MLNFSFLARKKQVLKILQDVFKLTAIILLVNLTPFLDLNVLRGCHRFTSDLKACIEIWKVFKSSLKVTRYKQNTFIYSKLSKCYQHTNKGLPKNICRTLPKSYKYCHTIFGAWGHNYVAVFFLLQVIKNLKNCIYTKKFSLKTCF